MESSKVGAEEGVVRNVLYGYVCKYMYVCWYVGEQQRAWISSSGHGSGEGRVVGRIMYVLYKVLGFAHANAKGRCNADASAEIDKLITRW